MEDKDGGAILAIGGVLTVLFIGIWALRFLQKLFIQLGKTFDAFGTMAASSLSMLGHVLLVVVLVAAIIGTVVTAVYFTYRYIMLVRHATAIREMVDRRLHESACNMEQALREFRSDVDADLDRMNRMLADALREPDPVPDLVAAKTEPQVVTSVGPEPVEQDANRSEPEPESEPPISQPY